MNTTNCGTRAALLPHLALAVFPGLPRADAQADDWRFTLTPYVWATDVGVGLDVGGRSAVDATIAVEDLLEDVEVIFQGRVEAQRGEHGLMLDLFHVSMADTESGIPLRDGSGQADIDWEMGLTIADIAGVYDPGGDGLWFSFLYGARIIDQTFDLSGTTTGGSGSGDFSAGGSDTLVDALGGLRFCLPITDSLNIQTEATASTGGTDLTWSVFPSLSWRFGDGAFALNAGYRCMEIDFRDEGGVEAEMTLSGPVLGFQFSL